MIDPGLEDTIALVTGANAGIGAATARALARQGAVVAIHYLEAESAAALARTGVQVEFVAAGRAAADALAAEIDASGGRAVVVEGDLSDPATPARLFDAVEAVAGPVDLLVNNAAHCELPDTIADVTAGTIDRHFSVNTRAAVLMIHELVSRHRSRGATRSRVVNISTDAARAFATQIAYGASKAALEAFTRSIAVEVGPLGITVNAIAPGPIQTGWISPELEARVVPSIPLGRVGTPEEVADAVVFLASHQARWITGQVIQVAGGHAL